MELKVEVYIAPNGNIGIHLMELKGGVGGVVAVATLRNPFNGIESVESQRGNL